MDKLAVLMASYKEYHSNQINIYSHLVGVPTVTFSIFLFLAWFRFVAPEFPISLAIIFFGAAMIHYFRLDKMLALYIFVIFGFLLILAEYCARLEFSTSMTIFFITFVVGWAFQLIGHYFEGRRPALVDNILQVFNAPLFIICEVLFYFGKRKDLEQKVNGISAVSEEKRAV